MMEHRLSKKAWIVAVSMGYGHERAAYGLADLAHEDEIIIANNYKGIPSDDRARWRKGREMYEAISRLQATPIVGKYIFEVMDRFQQIELFYPRRDLSNTTLQLRYTYRDIVKHGVCKDLIQRLSKHPLPLIATFFVAAFAADYYDYPGDIYCVICDADISRTWAPMDPKRSRIKYFAPNGRVVERLKLYGVPEKNIFLTGFPLPRSLIGGPEASILKQDLTRRLYNLDPRKIFLKRNEWTLHHFLGSHHVPKRPHHPLTLTFTVGGAGAQRTLGWEILESLRERIARHEIRLNLVAGVRHDVAQYFREAVKELRLQKELGTWVNVVHTETRPAYFDTFTRLLHTTDILWTKPSELSFYTGLGMPIIMAPPLGSQEDFNELWLKMIGGGIKQNDPRYTSEWLFDWVESGGLARAAWSGFIEAPTHGSYRIEEIISEKKYKLAKLPLIV